MATNAIKNTLPPAYANDTRVQADLQKLADNANNRQHANVQQLYDDMTEAQKKTKASDGRTYEQILTDMDYNLGSAGKYEQDLNALSTQMGTTTAVAQNLLGQAKTTTKVNLTTDVGAQKAFAKAWGNGNTDFAEEFKRDNPNFFATASNYTNGDGTLDFKKLPAGLKDTGGVADDKHTIELYRGNDGTLLVADNPHHTVQGYTKDGLRQATTGYNTAGGMGDAQHPQYISSGGATVYWGANQDDGGVWGVLPMN